jgi:hypothetical protein
MLRWTKVLLGSAIAVLGGAFVFGLVLAEPPAQKPRSDRGGNAMKEGTDREAELRKVVERFIASADKVDATALKSIYDPGFVCVRVADEGGMTKLSRDQMLGFMGALGALARGSGHAIPTKETVIHHVEVIGDDGFVLLTRTKNLGSGWEPMYYSLVWKRRGHEWQLLREFVHQRTMPKLLK